MKGFFEKLSTILNYVVLNVEYSKNCYELKKNTFVRNIRQNTPKLKMILTNEMYKPMSVMNFLEFLQIICEFFREFLK